MSPARQRNLASCSGYILMPWSRTNKGGRRILAGGFSPTKTTMNSRGTLPGRDGAECGQERAELAMVLDSPEALGGAQQAEPDPPPAHVAIAPALDVPRDLPQRPDEILDAVRGREEAAQG